MDDLTREQQRLLVSMYKEVTHGPVLYPDMGPNYFPDSDDVMKRFMPDKSSDYVSDLCWRLESKGYLECARGDDLANRIRLSDRTIIYMENRFKNGLKDISDFLLHFV
jgi:hypothetical protein